MKRITKLQQTILLYKYKAEDGKLKRITSNGGDAFACENCSAW